MPSAERLSAKSTAVPEERSFERKCEILRTTESFMISQGHYHPIYQRAGKGFIYFITLSLRSISAETRALLWKRLTASDGRGVTVAKLMKAK